MCVKSVELTCRRTFTRTHDILNIILSLPDIDIKPDLVVAWSKNVPEILKKYQDILYKNLNSYSGIHSKISKLKLECIFLCFRG